MRFSHTIETLIRPNCFDPVRPIAVPKEFYFIEHPIWLNLTFGALDNVCQNVESKGRCLSEETHCVPSDGGSGGSGGGGNCLAENARMIADQCDASVRDIQYHLCGTVHYSFFIIFGLPDE